MRKKRKRISVDELEVGMSLGDDVVDSNGIILIPNGTVLTQRHIMRIKLHQTLSVVIFEDSEEDILQQLGIQLDTDNIEDSVIRKDREAFNGFKNEYKEAEVRAKKLLNNISNGDSIQFNDLLSQSTTLLGALKTKNNIFRYLNYIRINDDYTYTHCLNVSLLCNIFASWLKLPQEKADELTVAGLLHDVGKIKIDESLLNKPGKLTEEEFAIMKKHSKYGYEIIQSQDISDDIKCGVLMHHEKMDGSGYPFGLKEEQIHEFAKIISIVDIYDAMTSNRSYHNKFSPFRVMQIFETDSFGLLDTGYLFNFLENIAYTYIGNTAKLTDGTEGKIVFIHRQAPSRPIIQTEDDRMIDLLIEPSLAIDEIV